jgi:hypothetical protein
MIDDRSFKALDARTTKLPIPIMNPERIDLAT